MRERGLKAAGGQVFISGWVAPRAGAWIESSGYEHNPENLIVAPRAGAWIESAMNWSPIEKNLSSLPVRERGLKVDDGTSGGRPAGVAPRAGAWIESK